MNRPALTLFLCLASSLPEALAQGPRFIDLANDSDRQVVVDREKDQYLGHPTTCVLDDGTTVLCVYPKGHGKGGIVYKRSLDAGKTWGERLPVPESWETSKEVPTIHRTVDAEGKKRIILFSGLYPIRMAVSEDEGESWSELEPIGKFGGIVTMSSVIGLNTGAGHYMALFHDDGRFLREDSKPEKPRIFTTYGTRSTDGGLTWDEPRAIYSSAQLNLCEPGALRSPDGKQIAVLLRENSRRKNSHIIFSDDEGETWSEPRELPITLAGDRHVAEYLPDSRLFISFRGVTPKGSGGGGGKGFQAGRGRGWMPTEGDWAGWVGRYRDLVEGHPGQYVIRFGDNKRGWDTSYPGVEFLRDGTMLTTTYGHWEEGESPYVISVRFKGSELDRLADTAPQLDLSDDGLHAYGAVYEVTSTKIWDAGKHNAFTDLCEFDGKVFCTFREGDRHVGGDGTIRVLVCKDGEGEQWESFAQITREGVDLRDPKLSVTPRGQLMLIAGGSRYDDDRLLGSRTLVTFLEAGAGKEFGELQGVKIDPRVRSEKDWLWRVTWQGETGYGVAYQGRESHSRAHLLSTKDGVNYELLRVFDLEHRPNEATVRFDSEGQMLVVIRNEGGNYSGHLGIAAPPFTDFKWQEVGERLGGPNFIQLPSGDWWLGSRRYSNPPRTVLGTLELDGGDFKQLVRLPSAGDTSYPGMMIRDGVLWISYYSSHEGKSAIYLTQLPVDKDERAAESEPEEDQKLEPESEARPR